MHSAGPTEREQVSACDAHKAYPALCSKVHSAAAEDRLLPNPTMKVQSFGMICVRIRGPSWHNSTIESV